MTDPTPAAISATAAGGGVFTVADVEASAAAAAAATEASAALALWHQSLDALAACLDDGRLEGARDEAVEAESHRRAVQLVAKRRKKDEALARSIANAGGRLASLLAALEAASDRDALLGDGSGGDGAGAAAGYDATAPGQTNRDVLGRAGRLQDKTDASLGRARRIAEEAREVGSEALGMLSRDRERIAAMRERVGDIDSSLNRTEKLIKNFAKRMATDRIIQVFFLLNMTLVIGVVAYMVADEQGMLDDDDDDGGGDDGAAAEEAPAARRFLRW
jgi:chromosome segregation ATPase